MMAIFELIDPVAGAPAPPGPWVSRPAAPVSFGVGTVPDAGAPIWRVNLPDDPQRARTALREAGQGLRAQQTALAAATDRIGRLAGGGASFAIGQQAAPELELLRLVGELRGEGEASFGLRETVSGGWNEAEQRFRAFAAQVHQTLANYALVETRVEQALIGRSSVDLSGGVRSLMRANLGIEQAEMHHTSLSLALESRAALLRTFTTVMRGAAIVATMLSSPIGTVAALPAAWKFVDQLLSDI